MKRILFSVTLLAMVIASCSKVPSENKTSDNGLEVKELADGSRQYTLYADCGKDDEDVKTDYAADKTFSWVAGDKISVLFHNGSNEPVWVDFVAESTAASSRFTATVDGELTMGAPTSGTHWALYPAHASHVYTSDTDIKFFLTPTHNGAKAEIPMIATSAAGSAPAFHFRHLGGALKMTVKNIRTEVSNIRVEFYTRGWETDGKGFRYVTGAFPVKNPSSSAPSIEANPGTTITSGSFTSSATVAVNPSTHSAVVYLPLPVYDVWNDVNFTVYDNDANVPLYDKKITRDPSGTLFEVYRKKITPLSDLTLADVDRSSKIQVDGYFDEWSTAEGVVSQTWPGTAESQPFVLKIASDGTNIWFYHAFDGSKVDLSYDGYIELFMDTDNDASTGDISDSKWYARGVDKNLVYYYSRSTGKVRTSYSFVRWETYNSGTKVWDTGGAAPASVTWAATQNAANDMFFEWGAPIASLGLTAGQTIRFGFVARKPQATSNNSLLSFTIPTPPAGD